MFPKGQDEQFFTKNNLSASMHLHVGKGKDHKLVQLSLHYYMLFISLNEFLSKLFWEKKYGRG